MDDIDLRSGEFIEFDYFGNTISCRLIPRF